MDSFLGIVLGAFAVLFFFIRKIKFLILTLILIIFLFILGVF